MEAATTLLELGRLRPGRPRGVGRVLDSLRDSGQLENTLVIYSADQGFSMGEHGFRAKLAPYEANFNSPLIVSFAGKLPEGKVCASPVCGGDLMTTFGGSSSSSKEWYQR